MLAHSAIQSVLACHDKQTSAEYCSAVRHAFFIDGLDISQWGVLKTIALKLHIDWEKVDQYFHQGHGLANLQQNFQQAAAQHITISPAWCFNEGRQKLIGNVGYRVIEANLKELVENKPLPQAWC
jgi:predicted DsbA family dithiol-disulfide isomerase